MPVRAVICSLKQGEKSNLSPLSMSVIDDKACQIKDLRVESEGRGRAHLRPFAGSEKAALRERAGRDKIRHLRDFSVQFLTCYRITPAAGFDRGREVSKEYQSLCIYIPVRPAHQPK